MNSGIIFRTATVRERTLSDLSQRPLADARGSDIHEFRYYFPNRDREGADLIGFKMFHASHAALNVYNFS